MYATLWLILCLKFINVQSVCDGFEDGTPPSQNASIPDLDDYNQALSNLVIMDVINDITKALTDSQDCWPADEFAGEASYAPFFIRLAWHCAGTYRATDGAGGCSGGRQRFPPEASWEDNTNLDKARALLTPIKNKYNNALSWGDLMIFAGTAAILNMGGPVNEICAGRIDSSDGTESLVLGPGPEAPPCVPEQGNCSAPLGADTVGLIYVNPQGFMGVPEPVLSARQIRDVFGRMDMNDRETVALIGGGHAFGKCHGACPAGPGDPPNVDPFDPWPGLCGEGNGPDTYTSGFEGQWTSSPLTWDNEFFRQLVEDPYELVVSSGNKTQWRNVNNGFMMLTSDLALRNDTEYFEIVKEYAKDINALNEAFASAWEKLVSDGADWADEKHCINMRDSDESDDMTIYIIIGAVVGGVVLFVGIGLLIYCCKRKKGQISQDKLMSVVMAEEQYGTTDD